MKFRDFVVISIALAILYVLIAKSGVFVMLFKKIAEWTAKGVGVLTTGGIRQ